MKIQEYINNMNQLSLNILNFLDNESEYNDHFLELTAFIEEHQISECKAEFRNLLRLLLIISNNHYRNNNFFNKIEQILFYLKEKIKLTFSNNDIFNIFKSNKRIFLFILQNQLIEVDDQIIHSMILENICYYYYFYNVIKPFISTQESEKIEASLLEMNPNIFEHFEENQKIGENDSCICQLIRNDLVVDFIIYINQTNIPLNTKIKISIFETNSLLASKSPSLIEYAAFYGSIQIFQYLKMNNAELESSLWIYAIHGKNAEIIHCLEELQIEPEDNTYRCCLKEAIKCHHNEIAKYIQDNLLIINNEDSNFGKINVIENNNSYCFQFLNFVTFSDSLDYKNNFFYFCQSNFLKAVMFLTKTSYLNANSIVISKIILFYQVENSLFISNLNSNILIEFNFFFF